MSAYCNRCSKNIAHICTDCVAGLATDQTDLLSIARAYLELGEEFIRMDGYDAQHWPALRDAMDHARAVVKRAER